MKSAATRLERITPLADALRQELLTDVPARPHCAHVPAPPRSTATELVFLSTHLHWHCVLGAPQVHMLLLIVSFPVPSVFVQEFSV
jgi:hypothetical protein